MHTRIFTWLGREFVELTGEAQPAANAGIETQQLFQSFNHELNSHGLSLDHTVRSRLWGRDRQSRARRDSVPEHRQGRRFAHRHARRLLRDLAFCLVDFRH